MKQSFNNRNQKDQLKLVKVITGNDAVDYSKDPTFIKRAQEAKEFFDKVGLPKELLKIREAQYGKK